MTTIPAMESTHLFEEVSEEINGVVLASKIRPATQQDIDRAAELHKAGACPHTVVFDTLGWPYDFRTCYTCRKGRGMV